ncbi:piggyBac transposable element-derived protein 4-like [Gastrophryne carolinensis]
MRESIENKLGFSPLINLCWPLVDNQCIDMQGSETSPVANAAGSEPFNSDPFRSGDSDDSAPELSDVRTWCLIDCGMDEVPPPRFPFTGSPGMKVDVEHNDPLAYLRLFLTDDIIEKIVTETNRYNEQQSATLHSKFSRNRKWEPVTKEDIWKFLGLILLSGVVGKPLQKWYWTTNKLLATPFFGTIMSECRFSLIMKNLHFTNNEEFDEATHPAPKLKKIWEVYQMIIKNFQQSYVPDRDISIDESLMAYKGHLSWIQYIASKRARFGIKSYMLCEYIWNSVIYTGKGTQFNPRLHISVTLVTVAKSSPKKCQSSQQVMLFLTYGIKESLNLHLLQKRAFADFQAEKVIWKIQRAGLFV